MKSILIVDDECDIADSLAELLSDTYNTSVAYDGADALRLIRTGNLDAVVLDLMMPKMSGEALLGELRQAGVRIPVLMVSAAKDVRERALRSGAQDFIAKPFNLRALKRKLANLLGSAGSDGSPGPNESS